MLIYLQMIETEEDRSKFEQIYLKYRGLMFHVAYKYLRHEQDAEDAVHHAFMKIAENITRVAEPDSPKTKQYVVTIVENRAIDMVRVSGRHQTLPLEEELCGAFEEPEVENTLAGCILKLTREQRQVIWLKYHHGYNLREIANMMEISLPCAQKIDQRAKKRLAGMLEERGVAV